MAEIVNDAVRGLGTRTGVAMTSVLFTIGSALLVMWVMDNWLWLSIEVRCIFGWLASDNDEDLF